MNGLGEKKLANLIQKETNLNIERIEYFRKLDEYVGLKNLGATCYINTYLQVCVVLCFVYFQDFDLKNEKIDNYIVVFIFKVEK